MLAPVERFNCMQNVEVVIEAEGRGGWHPRAPIFLFYYFYQNISKFLTTKVSYKISALLTNGEVNVVDLQFW